MNCLICSDLHIHAHKKNPERLKDCLDVLNWIFNTAKEKKCDYLVFAGDLFHERSKIDVLNYLRTFEVFMEHMLPKPPFQVYLLIGNHDTYHKESWDVNSVKPLSAISGVHIVDEPSTIDIGGVPFDFMPYTENPLEDIKKLKGKRKDLKVFIGHLAIDGAQLNTFYGTQADVVVEHDGEMCRVSKDIFAGWKRVFLGHYHGAQQLNKYVEYVGSPLQLSFGEAFQKKHVIVLDLDTLEKTYIENTFSPKHIITPQKDIKKHDLKDNFVRVVVDDIGVAELVELRNELTETCDSSSLEIIMQKDDKEEKEIVESATNILYNHDEMLEKYIEATGVPESLDKDLLLKWGKKICGGISV